MKFIKLGLIFSAIALFIFACSQTNTTNTNTANTSNIIVANTNAQPSATIDELASARKIYAENCVKCHKEDGTGGVSEINGKRIKAPNMTSDRKKNDKDEDWIDTINNGAKEDGMPAFKGKLTDEEIKSLVKMFHKDFQGK
ncbi:MAG: c-type cytochrome [Pyrinomonadaceae bacterium]